MNDIKMNEKFYNTLDYFLEKKNMSRCMLAKLCKKNETTLNPSKTNVGNRWLSVGFLLKICEVLEITPQDFFKQMLKGD